MTIAVEGFDTEWSSVWAIPATALLMLATVILVVRVIGLRSFSKMSSPVSSGWSPSSAR